MPPGRSEIAPDRFDAWVSHRVAEHPDTVITIDGPVTLLQWSGGGARCEAFEHDPLGLLLLRRGGYAVGLARGGILEVAKAGRRHVQSRTAAGGWSQQRFARRRENQADALVGAVRDHVERILVAGAGGIPAGLVTGGDRALVAGVLADPRLRRLGELPRRELPDLPDPDAKVLRTAVQRGRAVWVRSLTGDASG